MADHDNLRYTLDLARACVHKGEAHQSLAYLKSIQSEIDDLAGSSIWAEHEVIYAGALAGMNDRGAETAFEDALKRCIDLPEPDPAILMTAHGDYAKYLAGRLITGRARQHYREAEKIAENLGREECVAHFQMCLIRLGLKEANSPRLPAFQRLREAAKEGYTEVQQLEAWIHYTDQLEGFATQLVATRGGDKASVDYFRGVLSTITRGRN
jgi:hypothetical protein